MAADRWGDCKSRSQTGYKTHTETINRNIYQNRFCKLGPQKQAVGQKPHHSGVPLVGDEHGAREDSQCPGRGDDGAERRKEAWNKNAGETAVGFTKDKMRRLAHNKTLGSRLQGYRNPTRPRVLPRTPRAGGGLTWDGGTPALVCGRYGAMSCTGNALIVLQGYRHLLKLRAISPPKSVVDVSEVKITTI